MNYNKFNIDDRVLYLGNTDTLTKFGFTSTDPLNVTIIAVKFTKTSVYYDIIDSNSDNKITRNVEEDSIRPLDWNITEKNPTDD